MGNTMSTLGDKWRTIGAQFDKEPGIDGDDYRQCAKEHEAWLAERCRLIEVRHDEQVRELAKWLHSRIVVAENSPINDPEEDFCEDCLTDARAWLDPQRDAVLRILREGE